MVGSAALVITLVILRQPVAFSSATSATHEGDGVILAETEVNSGYNRQAARTGEFRTSMASSSVGGCAEGAPSYQRCGMIDWR